MTKTLISIIIWPIAAIFFLFGALIYTIALLLFPPYKLHGLAKIISSFFGTLKFIWI